MDLLPCQADVRRYQSQNDSRPPSYCFSWYDTVRKAGFFTGNARTKKTIRAKVWHDTEPATRRLTGLPASIHDLWVEHTLTLKKMTACMDRLHFHDERYNDLARLANEFYGGFINEELADDESAVGEAVESLNARLVALRRDVLKYAQADNGKQLLAKDRVLERMALALSASDEAYGELTSTANEALDR